MTPLNTGTMARFTALVKALVNGTALLPAQVCVRLPYRGYSKHARVIYIFLDW